MVDRIFFNDLFYFIFLYIILILRDNKYICGYRGIILSGIGCIFFRGIGSMCIVF